MGRILDIVFDIVLFVVVEQVLTRVIAKVLGGRGVRFSHPGFRPRREERKETLRGEAARDPSCGMFVSPDVAHRLNWRGKTLYFCSQECLERYRKRAAG
ncbi:MAG: hypothetical protein ACRD3D_12785 [Terriglobia bacterium]